MLRVLITGMSGTGKSTLIGALRARGRRAVDLDEDGWSHWAPAEGDPTGATPGHDWVWRLDRLAALLASEEQGGDVFVAGCAPNMAVVVPRFDHVVLLSAPAEVLLERRAARSGNPYGKRPEEAAQVVENLRLIEPLLRRIASCEIDARDPLDEIVEAVLALC